METFQQLKNKAQKVFNEYIRLRDRNRPCISCGEFKVLQAGHFFPVGSFDSLRFDENNCFGECEQCNCIDVNHLYKFRQNLSKRLTPEDYHNLHQQADNYKMFGYKFSKNELIMIIEKFKLKIKEL